MSIFPAKNQIQSPDSCCVDWVTKGAIQAIYNYRWRITSSLQQTAHGNEQGDFIHLYHSYFLNHSEELSLPWDDILGSVEDFIAGFGGFESAGVSIQRIEQPIISILHAVNAWSIASFNTDSAIPTLKKFTVSEQTLPVSPEEP